MTRECMPKNLQVFTSFEACKGDLESTRGWQLAENAADYMYAFCFNFDCAAAQDGKAVLGAYHRNILDCTPAVRLTSIIRELVSSSIASCSS